MSTPTPQPVPSFPWPGPTPEDRGLGQMSGSEAMMHAMEWHGLTPAERCLAMYVADGWCGPDGGEQATAAALEVGQDDFLDLLWALLRKGYLVRIARRWSL